MAMTTEEKATFDAAVSKSQVLETEKSGLDKQLTDSKKYATERDAVAQRVSSHMGKMKGYVEGLGIGSFDDKYNFTPIEKKTEGETVTPEQNRIDSIGTELKDLKKELDSEDIESSDYYYKRQELVEERLELKSELKIKTLNQENQDSISAQKAQDTADTEAATASSRAEATTKSQWDNINDKYPEHSQEDSVLFKEMDSLVQSDPNSYVDPNNNPMSRMLLAQQAYVNLLQRGEANKVKQKMVKSQFHTMRPSTYETSEDVDRGIEDEMSIVKEGVMHSGLSEEQAASITKSARNALKTGEWEIDT